LKITKSKYTEKEIYKKMMEVAKQNHSIYTFLNKRRTLIQIPLLVIAANISFIIVQLIKPYAFENIFRLLTQILKIESYDAVNILSVIIACIINFLIAFLTLNVANIIHKIIWRIYLKKSSDISVKIFNKRDLLENYIIAFCKMYEDIAKFDKMTKEELSATSCLFKKIWEDKKKELPNIAVFEVQMNKKKLFNFAVPTPCIKKLSDENCLDMAVVDDAFDNLFIQFKLTADEEEYFNSII